MADEVEGVSADHVNLGIHENAIGRRDGGFSFTGGLMLTSRSSLRISSLSCDRPLYLSVAIMVVKLRLARHGRKNTPFYHLVSSHTHHGMPRSRLTILLFPTGRHQRIQAPRRTTARKTRRI